MMVSSSADRYEETYVNEAIRKKFEGKTRATRFLNSNRPPRFAWQGNHGEDCKECYYYLDSTPTHSYMKALYKYPQGEYPYERLVKANHERGIHQPELELEDTGTER